MKYSVDKQERYTIFGLEEDNLNSVIAPVLKSEFVLMHNEGIPNMILDLTNVKYVDSSGLSSILTANRLWKENGSFILTGIHHPSVKRLIEISRLDSILTIIPSIDESVDYILMEELERELKEDSESE